jgi:Flp pilus assembly pilin Flp
MNMGVMDSSGVDLTEYGRILGIISVCMWIIGLLVLAFWLATRIPAV